MKLYLARHCLTNYNEQGLCNYETTVDVHLTPAGFAQAAALADKLKHARFDHLFVSELKRTVQTAEAINRFHGLALEVDPRLNDIDSGFEGRPFREYARALEAADNRWTARFNGGESLEDMKERVAGFMTELKTKAYDAVLIVTSEWIIRAILCIEQGLRNEEAWDVAIEQGGYILLEL